MACAAFIARAWPYVVRPVLVYPTSFDDGVYFSAAALFVRGELPYRDFVLVHPPGVVFAYAAPALLSLKVDVAQAFMAARWMAVLLGTAAATVITAAVASRWGLVGAAVAGLSYAFFPMAVEQERSVYLEPVLNLLCAASFWILVRLNPGAPRPAHGVLGAGVLLGLAGAVKLWAISWALALLLLVWPLGRRRMLLFVSAAAVTYAVVCLPFVLLAPGSFVAQVFGMQLLRPADGDPREAIAWTMASEHWGTLVFALLMAGVALARRRELPRAFWAATAALGLSALLFWSARAYWSVYNAYFGVPMTLMAGIALARAIDGVSSRIAIGLVVLGMASLGPSLSHARRRTAARDPALVEIADRLRRVAPGASCVATLEPANAVAAGRLPSYPGEPPYLVDSYGAMLSVAVAGADHRDTPIRDVFRRPEAQRYVLEALRRCDVVYLGWRGDFQLDEGTRAALRADYAPCGPPKWPEALLCRSNPFSN